MQRSRIFGYEWHELLQPEQDGAVFADGEFFEPVTCLFSKGRLLLTLICDGRPNRSPWSMPRIASTANRINPGFTETAMLKPLKARDADVGRIDHRNAAELPSLGTVGARPRILPRRQCMSQLGGGSVLDRGWRVNSSIMNMSHNQRRTPAGIKLSTC